MNPEQAKHWYDALLPIAERGGPILTLGLLVMLCVSMWFFTGWLHDCVDRNRLLGERLVEQQQRFHQDILLRLAHCPPTP